MSGLMSAIGQGVSAAGYAAGDAFAKQSLQQQQTDASLELQRQKGDIDFQREKRLEEFKQSLQDAPLNRLGASAQKFAGEDVPQEPLRATTLPPYNPSDTSGEAHFHGDIAATQRAIQNLPEPDRSAALAQLQQQTRDQQQVEADKVAGQTRKRSPDEALFAAVADAKVNDLPAYAAYEKEIGKPKRDERRLDVQQDREDNRATAAATSEERKARADAQRYEVELRRIDLQSGSLEATNRKIDAWIENEATKRDIDEAKANNPKANNPERLYSIVNAMNATIKQLQDSSKGNTPEAQAEWKRQLDTSVRVRDRASALLDDVLSTRGAPTAPGSVPAPAASAAKRPPLSSFQK